MLELRYVITDPLGIHARPAGKLVKEAGAFECDIRVGRPGAMVDAKRIMGVMGLAMKQLDTLAMTFDGPDEQEAAKALESFLTHNL